MEQGRYRTTEICKEFNISRTKLYDIIKRGNFSFSEDQGTYHYWTSHDIKTLFSFIDNDENKIVSCQTTNINNRRYLGNKYRLIPFIKDVVKNNCKDINIVADIFAGTGAVSSAFTDKQIITNDILYSNYICHLAWFGTEHVNLGKIKSYIIEYNSKNMSLEPGNYMSENFSNTYFGTDACKKIGYVREDIEKKFKNKFINERERAVLITSLLYAMDKIANTCGHYDAYIKNCTDYKKLEMSLPVVSNNMNKKNIAYNNDANAIVKQIKADLVYIDPPYNSRQYCDIYHLLENVAKCEKPQVSGIAKKMSRNYLKSEYCTKNAVVAFEDLISNIKAKYILFSYNNMANKGNDRSNARISDKDIMRILSAKGKVSVFSSKYKAFNAGKTDINDNEERLFLCVCKNNLGKNTSTIQSPLNYTGGKYKLLPQILPLFPKNISTFVDLFCGGCNVGLNVPAKKIIFNDINSSLISLYKMLKKLDKNKIFKDIEGIIEKYNLSESSKYGYAKYCSDSAAGLGNYNKKNFLAMRKDFNSCTKKDSNYYMLLYVLIVFSFNNQIRFNNSDEFNLPVGKRDFNLKMQEKLSLFVDTIKSLNCVFTNNNFRNIKPEKLPKNSFIYCDPPYLITCAAYNEKSAWTSSDEKDLLKLLDSLDKKRIKFALSNVLFNKQKKNEILFDWINKRNYKVFHLNKSYANSNYHSKIKENDTKEVLIVNYNPEFPL